MHCPSLSPPSKSDAYQVLNIFYKLSTHIYHHGAPDGLMPGLLPSSHTQTPPVTLEPSFCHIPPTFMRLQALHCVEHVGRGRTLSNPHGARGMQRTLSNPQGACGTRRTLSYPRGARGMWRTLCNPRGARGMRRTLCNPRGAHGTWRTLCNPRGACGTWRTLSNPQASPLISSLSAPRHELSVATA